jgi:hypothetical protein
MNFIFISPHFPPNVQQFAKALRAEGVNVLGIGDAPFHVLNGELRSTLTEYYHTPDMHRYDPMFRAVAHFSATYGRIQRIESMNEHWLETEARLREDFNIQGPRPADLMRFRSKLGMKDVFRRHGLPCAEGECVVDRGQLERFVSRVGYPVVLKPDIGTGASHLIRATCHDELKPWLERPPNGYLVEACLNGEQGSFDGLVDGQGDIVFFTSLRRSADLLEIVRHDLDMHYYFRRQIPAVLEALGRKTVEAFGLRERFFHIEFTHQGDAEYTFTEIDVRPPGGFSLDMMNFQCDFDLYRIYADLVAHGRKPPEPERKYCVAHAARRHGRAYRYSHDELVHRLGNRLLAHMPIPEVFSADLGNYTYLVRDLDESALRETISMVQEKG